MPFTVRLLSEADIPQSVEIERQAFPTLFPPTSFRRERRNRNISYLVARRIDPVPPTPSASSPPTPLQPMLRRGLVGSLRRNVGHVWGRPSSERGQDFIAGYLGLWYRADEAHIVSVGVRNEYRGEGIGEMLVIGAIEQAMARQAVAVTLEVRPSNRVAINLYHKYGFREKGVRKGYYSNNREDAIIMTTNPIQHPDFRDFFLDLEREHRRRWGNTERIVV